MEASRFSLAHRASKPVGTITRIRGTETNMRQYIEGNFNQQAAGDIINIHPPQKDWIVSLVKQWANIRRERAKELEELKNIFALPDLLAKYYIEPDCQPTNPAEHHEDEPRRGFRGPIQEQLSEFFKGEFIERDGRNTTFILSDAGMGKTSLLLMLKLYRMTKGWPNNLEIILKKLGPETLDLLRGVVERSKTILLLDALDEDPMAWGRIRERLEEILRETHNFRQVIITCRTQFFPESDKTRIEQPNKVVVGGYTCNLLYLSLFTDKQVEQYLHKVYPNRIPDKVRKWITQKDNAHLQRARELVIPMKSLRMRPMLLAHIKDLIDQPHISSSEYGIYLALVDGWLRREQRKAAQVGKPRPTANDLWNACRLVAIYLQACNKRALSEADISKLLNAYPEIQHISAIDVGGRSLLNKTAEGEYRFSHYSIQEFLIASVITEQPRLTMYRGLRLTDKILSFLIAWRDEGENRRIPLPNANLSGIRMIEADLRNIDLTGSELKNACLERANLLRASLQNATLEGANLNGARLQGANLSGAVFGLPGLGIPGEPSLQFTITMPDRGSGERVTKTILRMKPDPQENIIKIGKLSSSQLRLEDESVARMHAVIEATSAESVYIIDLGSARGTLVNGHQTSRGKLRSGDKIMLGDVGLTIMIHPAFQAASLRGADLMYARLQSTMLAWVDLREANLQEADLTGANLSHADLSQANLRDATLKDVNFSGANLTGTLFSPGVHPRPTSKSVTPRTEYSLGSNSPNSPRR